MRGLKHKEEGKWKRIAVFFLLLLVFGFLLNSLNNVYKKKKEAEAALAHMKEQVVDLQKREEFLKESLSKLDTEEGMKFEIRKKLNVAEVGESVAVIVDEEQKVSVPTYSASTWQKFKDFFSWLLK